MKRLAGRTLFGWRPQWLIRQFPPGKPGIQGRQDKEGHNRGCDQPTDNDGGQGFLYFCPYPMGQQHGDEPEGGGDRRHQNGPLARYRPREYRLSS